MNSTQIDPLLGYFGSSAIHILSIGFALFLLTGGILRMLINDVVSEDKQAVIQSQIGNIDPNVIDLSDVAGLRHSFDAYGEHFFESLAWLVAHYRIQIKVIRLKKGEA